MPSRRQAVDGCRSSGSLVSSNTCGARLGPSCRSWRPPPGRRRSRPWRAVLVSVVNVRLHLQHALAPRASVGAFGAAHLGRWVLRTIAGAGVARTTASFILLTLARSPGQRTPIAVNAAVGLAFVAVGLTRINEFTWPIPPRTAILWAPLVMAFWMTIGLRA